MPEDGQIFAYVNYPQGDIDEVIERLRAFTAESNSLLTFSCYNLYPYDDLWEPFGYDANGIVWRIENGNIATDGQEIIIFNSAEGFQLLLECWWMAQIEAEKLEKYGVSVVLETANDAPKTWKLRECGITTGLRIEYGVLGEPRQVITKQDAVALVEKTPIVYIYLPEDLQQDRDVAIAFIKNNDRYAAAYRDMLMELNLDIDEDRPLRSSHSVRAENEELFLDGMPWVFPEALENLVNDEGILTLLGNSSMKNVVGFTDETYNENIVSKAIGKAPLITHALFDYWYNRLPRDKKTDEHIREKYELNADDSRLIVTLFKCIEVIESCKDDTASVYANLFAEFNTTLFDGAYGKDRNEVLTGYMSLFRTHRQEATRIFRVLSAEDQNELAREYYFFASLIKPANLDPKLAALIAEDCPIARQLLPDEYILKYNLTDEQPCDFCQKCAKCHWANMNLIISG